MRNFREYDVWKNAIQFCKLIYHLTESFPETERYVITSQLQRASISIASNIAEGCSRKSERDFARFIEIALGSAFEVESLLQISLEIKYIDKKDFTGTLEKLAIIQKQLNSLYGVLRR